MCNPEKDLRYSWTLEGREFRSNVQLEQCLKDDINFSSVFSWIWHLASRNLERRFFRKELASIEIVQLPDGNFQATGTLSGVQCTHSTVKCPECGCLTVEIGTGIVCHPQNGCERAYETKISKKPRPAFSWTMSDTSRFFVGRRFTSNVDVQQAIENDENLDLTLSKMISYVDCETSLGMCAQHGRVMESNVDIEQLPDGNFSVTGRFFDVTLTEVSEKCEVCGDPVFLAHPPNGCEKVVIEDVMLDRPLVSMPSKRRRHA